MSYRKAMKHKPHRQIYCGFSIIAPNERRRIPWLGGSWFEEGRDAERENFIKKWQEETLKMLKENPDLKIID